jgi:hypothetical protein
LHVRRRRSKFGNLGSVGSVPDIESFFAWGGVVISSTEEFVDPGGQHCIPGVGAKARFIGHARENRLAATIVGGERGVRSLALCRRGKKP